MDELYIVENADGVAVVRLQAGKANAMNPAFLEAGAAALDKAAGARALVLTGYDRFFCAGLDLVTLPQLPRPRMLDFVRQFDRLVLRLFTWPAPVVAAVNGHAVAGGCILALACDVRLMARGQWKMGLNEIELGLPFPASALEVARAAIPAAHLDTMLYGGQLYGPDEMHAKGVVDGLADPASVVLEAREVAQHLAARPAPAFAGIKAGLRGPSVARIQAEMGGAAQRFVEAWFHPEAQARIAGARKRFGQGRPREAGASSPV